MRAEDSIQGSASSLPSTPASGLTSAEAGQRLKIFGYNELPRDGARGLNRIVFDVLREPMFLLLVVAASLYLMLGSLHEGLALFAFALVSVGIVVYQSHRTEHVLTALRDLSSPRAVVVRDGAESRIPGREVVPGDLVVVAEGDRVPADAVLVRGTDVSADESQLTGESVPVRKIPGNAPMDNVATAPSIPGGEDRPFLYSGCLVVKGQGLAVVTATGAATQLGKIGRSVQGVERAASPMQKQIFRLVRTVAVLGAALSVAVALLQGVLQASWIRGLLAGITLEMAVLPEEFPMILTVFMALGAWRLSKRRILTRRAAAIETLGAASVLCVDKTGTLTENRMRVVRLFAAGRCLDMPPAASELPEEFHEVVEYAILASRQRAFDPMEQAVYRLGSVTLAGTEHVHADWNLAQEYELTPGFLAMSQGWSAESGGVDGGYVVAAKGAPEAVIDLCHLPTAQAEHWMGAVRNMAQMGLRVIAVAKGVHRGEVWPANQHDLDFAPVGLIGLADPVRAAVPAAIAACRSAGIRVAMITGDYPETAKHVAEQAGLVVADGVLTGADIESLSDAELQKRVRVANVFARVVPQQKLRIVEALKRNGAVVAMTGDGVNDAPALKAAHVGIAMGGRGTDVAREAAALVLLEDNFESIVTAISLGRRIYANLRRALAYTLAIHVPIAGLALLPLLLGAPPMLFPVHVVFLQLFIDPVCSIVFEAEPSETDAMAQAPRAMNEPLFSGRRLYFSLLQGAVLLTLVLSLYVGAFRFGMHEDAARALAFAALIAGNVGLVLVNRSWRMPMWATLTRPNRALWVATGMTVVVGLLLFVIPPVQALFKLSTANPSAVGTAAMLGIASTFWFEMIKRRVLH